MGIHRVLGHPFIAEGTYTILMRPTTYAPSGPLPTPVGGRWRAVAMTEGGITIAIRSFFHHIRDGFHANLFRQRAHDMVSIFT